ncbi:HAMP domain-containing sensor histidine kinase [Lactobacillaceae bacterium L1_55_11]|nr:HAMP domain-containing sensor histidine kinase [Lactobacillaceae bacterium L1_55_11]
MAKNQNQKPAKSHRFSLHWQLSLGMMLVFFIIGILLATVLLWGLEHYYSFEVDRTWPWLLGTAVAAAVLAFLVTFFLIKLIVRPVHTIEDTIRAFEADPMTDQRAQDMGMNDEFSDLAKILNQMIDRLQDLIRSQQQFVSDVSHELRTPVAVVKGHMGLLNRWGKDDPEVLEESIQASLSEVERMETLINEMLNLTRAEQIPEQKSDQITDVGAVVQRIFSDFQMLHPDFILTFDNDLSRPAEVRIRRDHLEQILIILADNAVKYSTDRREIHFALSQSATRVEIGIQDFGEGIAAEDLEKIFDRFYRVDRARNHHTGGNGLGLSIAECLVTAYGGQLTVESALGSGSVFTIWLPLIDKTPGQGYEPGDGDFSQD